MKKKFKKKTDQMTETSHVLLSLDYFLL